MNKESQNTVADTSTGGFLPAVECAPWCQNGTGHADAWHPLDQYCMSQSHRLSLTREDSIEGMTADTRQLDFLSMYLVHEAFEVEPHVSLNRNDRKGVDLTPDEALELARVLTVLAGAARSHR